MNEEILKENWKLEQKTNRISYYLLQLKLKFDSTKYVKA